MRVVWPKEKVTQNHYRRRITTLDGDAFPYAQVRAWP